MALAFPLAEARWGALQACHNTCARVLEGPSLPLALLIWLAMTDGAKSAGIACLVGRVSHACWHAGVLACCMGSGVRSVVGGRFCGSWAGLKPIFCTNALQ